MMEFCSSCGFLLASELVGKSIFCPPCRVSQENKRLDKECHCEICGFSKSSARSSSKPISRNCDESLDDKTVNDESKSKKLKKGKAKENRFQKKDQPHSDPTSYDRESEWEKSGHKNPWGDEPWVKRTSDPNTHATFGDYDFPVLQQGLTERKVDETIRADWERQQEEYKSKLVMEDTKDVHSVVNSLPFKEKRGKFLIAGVDISFIKNDETNACACLTILALPDLKMMYQAIELVKLRQPYIPGFLAFREIPPLMVLFENLKRDCPHYLPDMIMVDGNGILHPRGFGMASQLGVLLDIPTIGVAKSLISAQGITDDDAHKAKKHKLKEAGDGFDLISEETNQVLGKCLVSHDKAPNPIYVSVGHKITLESAIWLTLECCKYREPEPIRRADLDSRVYLRMRNNKPQLFVQK